MNDQKIQTGDYLVTGFYNLEEKTFQFEGQISIGEKGDVLGSVKDNSDPAMKQSLDGIVFEQDGHIVLSFAKIPGVYPFMASEFNLAKKLDDIEGWYVGMWSMPVKHLDFYGNKKTPPFRETVLKNEAFIALQRIEYSTLD